MSTTTVSGGSRPAGAFTTIKEIVTFEKEIKKNKFIAIAGPISDEESAFSFLSQVKDPRATHNCWAYKVGDQFRSNDDGEPSGTAGKPIQSAIDSSGIDRVMVVVIRYFGGIKLGAEGLVRAYEGVASECLWNAPTSLVKSKVPDVMASHVSAGASVQGSPVSSEPGVPASQPEVQQSQIPPAPLPLTVENMFDLLKRLVAPHLQPQSAQALVAPSPQPARDVVIRDYAKFRDSGGIEFVGTTNPIEAEQWLERIDRVAYSMCCDDAAKFDYAVHLLQGSAYEWWKTIPHYNVRPPVLTWTDFVKYFRARYVPVAWVQVKQQQFLTLVQGNRRVVEYAEEFVRLSRYGRELIPDDVQKCERFIMGLHPYLKGPVAAQGFSDLAQMISFCHAQEMFEEEKAALEGRALYPVPGTTTTSTPRFGGSQSSSTYYQHQKRKGSGQSRWRSRYTPYDLGSRQRSVQTAYSIPSEAQPPQGSVQIPQCPTCHRFHIGNCRFVGGACFTCGQQGHYARDCSRFFARSAPAATQGSRQQQLVQVSFGSRARGRGRGLSQRTDVLMQSSGLQNLPPPPVQPAPQGNVSTSELQGSSTSVNPARVYTM